MLYNFNNFNQVWAQQFCIVEDDASAKDVVIKHIASKILRFGSDKFIWRLICNKFLMSFEAIIPAKGSPTFFTSGPDDKLNNIT